ncbi:hypothetical protein CANINC_004636 [Pichia inconspicua]|uniref:DNA polymerase alpha/delta/epsilon subunit B domain-containing protein n=1 Tax=Pichia inconspicua TaxID=52247 RepID=A0A4T0WVZ1_9ASCO|nr:hypothetical protein CANINC_004636 [[Candida] inconspicua]
MTTSENVLRPTPIYSGIKDDTFCNPTKTRNYNAQFNKIYTHRTNELKSRVMKMANPKWSGVEVNGMKPKFVPKVLDVPSLKPVYIIGTTLADMKFKPDVLKEVELSVQGHFTELKELVNDAGGSNKDFSDLRQSSYSDPETDKIWLEDESGRILLTGDVLTKKIIVTGLVVAVLGMEIESGIFHVVDIVYPEPAPQRDINLSENTAGKLLLTGGLNISDKSKFDYLEILKSWIFGEFDDEKAKYVAEMMIVGNSLDITSNDVKMKSEKNKYAESFNMNYSERPTKYLDTYISELLQSIPISVLPGPRDIVELGLPKQPLHHSLFPISSKLQNFKRLTEPSFYDINGLRILVSSGEPVNDIMKYIIPNLKSEGDLKDCLFKDSRLRIIEDMLLWQVIAPTAPDTLWCYPFENTDPFTLKETPHVYIVGNQPRFETSVVELQRKNGDVVSIRVIALPDFDDTKSVVLLDLQSLSCEIVAFECTA